MRTITLEEYFRATGFRETMRSNASQPGGNVNILMTAERQAKLTDLGSMRLKGMDASGIDLQVISNITSFAPSRTGDEEVELAQEANNQLADAIAAHPDRFAGFASLPMSKPEAAADELKRAVHSLGLKGPMIFGLTGGRILDDPIFLPVLERAVELGVPIYLHTSEPPGSVREAYFTGLDPAMDIVLATSGWGWHSKVSIHALRMILNGVFDRLPNLQIIIGHMGEMIPFMLARINDVFTPVIKHLQYPVTEYFLHNFHITNSGFFTDPPLLLALQVMGGRPHHVLHRLSFQDE